jgi:actin-related protein 3
MYKDFARRLNRDIKRMVDARILHSQVTSQINVANDAQIKARQIEVNVISHKKQRYAVWFGGSLLAGLVILVNAARISFLLSHQSSI